MTLVAFFMGHALPETGLPPTPRSSMVLMTTAGEYIFCKVFWFVFQPYSYSGNGM